MAYFKNQGFFFYIVIIVNKCLQYAGVVKRNSESM